jgi:hypothetical protein
MTDAVRPASSASILGVFLIIGGTGIILDGSLMWRGLGAIGLGIVCLLRSCPFLESSR